MVYDFLITLKKQDHQAVDLVSRFMIIFSLIVFAFYYYHYPKSGAAYLYFGIGIIITWIYTTIKKRRDGQAYYRLALFIGSVGWFIGSQKNIWMAILYAIAGLLEKQVKFPQEIGFSETELTFNTFLKKVLKWNEVNNALIKDGLITIDLKNNKLFQREIEGYVTDDMEREFNEFCHRCITANDPQNEVAKPGL